MLNAEDDQTKNKIVVDNINQDYGGSFIPALTAKMASYPNHHIYVDELMLPKIEKHPQVAKELEKIVQSFKQSSGGRCMWLAVAGIEDGKPEDFNKDYMQSIFKSFYIPVLQFPLRSTRAVVQEALGGKTNTTVDVTGGLTANIDINLPDNLVEGIKPVIITYEDGNLSQGVRQAMEIVNDEEGSRGVAILTTASGITAQYDDICAAAVATGRLPPIWYSWYDSKGVSSTDVADWLHKRESGQQVGDLVTDYLMSRGWEDRTVIVVDKHGYGGRVENLGMRAVYRLIIVKQK